MKHRVSELAGAATECAEHQAVNKKTPARAKPVLLLRNVVERSPATPCDRSLDLRTIQLVAKDKLNWEGLWYRSCRLLLLPSLKKCGAP
jgi:hypothetical protein